MQVPGSQSAKKSSKAVESRKKVVKMLITVFVVFVACWLPVQVLALMWDYGGYDIPAPATFACKFLMRAHACTSPCIYAAFSENFRNAFHVALLKCVGKDKSSYINLGSNIAMSTRKSQATSRKSLGFQGGQGKRLAHKPSDDSVLSSGDDRSMVEK